MDANEIKKKASDIKGEAEKLAEKELAKAKKELEKAGKKIESYVRKNPKKAAAITAGIGAALGAVAAVLLKKIGPKKKKK